MNNSNEKIAINKFRTWIIEFRAETNKLCDKYLKRLDEWELKVAKETQAVPQSVPEEERI